MEAGGHPDPSPAPALQPLPAAPPCSCPVTAIHATSWKVSPPLCSHLNRAGVSFFPPEHACPVTEDPWWHLTQRHGHPPSPHIQPASTRPPVVVSLGSTAGPTPALWAKCHRTAGPAPREAASHTPPRPASRA